MRVAVLLVAAALGVASARPAAAEAPATAAPDPLAAIPKSQPGAPPFDGELRKQLARALESAGDDYSPRTRHLRPDGTPRYSNRLLLETSPYLQQHAHNPVDWRPWGKQAFAAARALDRPILVSIGYSTCHWCHVMEEETFDDPEVASYLNANFIAIKVDREARPDVDAIYMSAVHAMGQSGGWPLNVWLTPDGAPFYGGTYFPPEKRGGRPAFVDVLRTLRRQYETNRTKIDESAQALSDAVRRQLAAAVADTSQLPKAATIDAAKKNYAARFDHEWGGVGSRTKFPSSLPIRFLLRYHQRTGDPAALSMAVLTLEKMAAGGIHDHVGGGFHRYATEKRWLVPHFEKMLYDNALIALAYLEAAQLTGRADFRRVLRSTLDYVAREMTAPVGGFYSATDADSENEAGESEEGWFFTWTPAEIEAAVGPPLARTVTAWYGVTPGGTYEGRNILHTWQSEAEVAARLGLTPEALKAQIDEARLGLYEARARRIAPLRDEKILVEWNGLMISAFARAGFVLAEEGYLEQARRAARFVIERMTKDGRLSRVWLAGRASGPAFLEDYANLIAGLLDLYEADPDPRWIEAAIRYQRTLDAHYLDSRGGGYFRTADDGELLLVREKPMRDGAVPSGNGVTASNLLRLAELTLEEAYLDRVMLLFSAFHDSLRRQPTSLAEMLMALDFHLHRTKEIVLVQPEAGDADGAMMRVLRRSYVTNRVQAIVRQGDDLAAHAAFVPLLSGKVAQGGRTTAYVCVAQVCAYPTDDPKVFEEQLTAP